MQKPPVNAEKVKKVKFDRRTNRLTEGQTKRVVESRACDYKEIVAMIL